MAPSVKWKALHSISETTVLNSARFLHIRKCCYFYRMLTLYTYFNVVFLSLEEQEDIDKL